MKYVTLAAVSALVLGGTATAKAENSSSAPSAAASTSVSTTSPPAVSHAYPGTGSDAAALNALLADWDRAGFNPPSKPSQYRVLGRDGYVTSGPGYNAMVSSIRAAVRDTEAGHDHAASQDIARARGLLTTALSAAPQIDGKA